MSCKIKLILQSGAIIIRCNCFMWSCGFCSFKDFVFDDCCFLIGRRIFLFNNAHVYPVHAVDGVEVSDKNTYIKQPSKYSLTSPWKIVTPSDVMALIVWRRIYINLCTDSASIVNNHSKSHSRLKWGALDTTLQFAKDIGRWTHRLLRFSQPITLIATISE